MFTIPSPAFGGPEPLQSHRSPRLSVVQSQVRSLLRLSVAGSGHEDRSPSIASAKWTRNPFKSRDREAAPGLPSHTGDMSPEQSHLRSPFTSVRERFSSVRQSFNVPGLFSGRTVVEFPEPAHVASTLPAESPSVDSEQEVLADDVQHTQTRRRRHRRRRREQQGAWIRKSKRRHRSHKGCFPRHPAARHKLMICIISGSFLATVLAIYLSIALTARQAGTELHVLFILIILLTTVLFCHSLIRMWMIAARPPTNYAHHGRIPSATGPEGFRPNKPIKVHLARDEDVEDLEKASLTSEQVRIPPPAYGLWRSSVRADPNLLYWQLNTDVPAAPSVHSATSLLSSNSSRSSPRLPSASSVYSQPTNGNATPPIGTPAEDYPRPPSYVSDDGVDYVISAGPRSTAPPSVISTPDLGSKSPAVGRGHGIGVTYGMHTPHIPVPLVPPMSVPQPPPPSSIWEDGGREMVHPALRMR